MDSVIFANIANDISSGGTVNGSLTIDGDLTVNGDGSGNYDEIVNGNMTISSTNKLVLGGDGSDTYLQESGADVLDIYVGGANMIKLTESTTDTMTVTGALTIGSDGSGHDVTFNSGTSGDSFAWDASEEKLTITGTNGQTALDIADGNLVVADNIDLEGDIDVNGTANLDNTDIDGTLTQDAGNVVFNEASGDYDFRIESNGNANMFFVDGGNDRVGIDTNAPAETLSLGSTTPSSHHFIGLYGDAGNYSAALKLYNESSNVGYIGYEAGGGVLKMVYGAYDATTGLTIDSSGRVLIGTSSVDGTTELLNVYSSAASAGPNIAITSGLTDGSAYMGGTLYRINDGADTVIAYTKSKEHSANSYGIDIGGYGSVGSPGTIMSLQGTGNVGIGTSSPGYAGNSNHTTLSILNSDTTDDADRPAVLELAGNNKGNGVRIGEVNFGKTLMVVMI